MRPSDFRGSGKHNSLSIDCDTGRREGQFDVTRRDGAVHFAFVTNRALDFHCHGFDLLLLFLGFRQRLVREA